MAPLQGVTPDDVAGPSRPQSSRPAQPVQQEGETWREFLRVTADETANAARQAVSLSRNQALPSLGSAQSAQTLASRPQLSRNSSSHGSTSRKREHSASVGHVHRAAPAIPHTPPRAGPSYLAAGSSSQRGARVPGTAGSENNPIDLTSPPQSHGHSRSNTLPLTLPPARLPSHQQQMSHTSYAPLHVPEWQPDDQVTHCTACGNAFSWYYRKHHCRKCGKVVCANCSTHRITIPRQFVVNPPPKPRLSSNPVSLIQSRESPEPPTNVSGAQTVRVCNPCVPDPNFAPPAQQGQTLPFSRLQSFPGQLPSRPDQPPGYEESTRASQTVTDSQRSARLSYLAAQARNSRTVSYTQSPFPGNALVGIHNAPSGSQIASTSLRDHCPVCSRRLPPRDPLTGDNEQTAHINRCIGRAMQRHRSHGRAHSDDLYAAGQSSAAGPSGLPAFGGTSAPGASVTTGMLAPDPRFASHARVMPSYIDQARVQARTHAVLNHALAMRRAGLLASSAPAHPTAPEPPATPERDMLHFRATLQDVENTEEKGGPAQECIICLEDFEVGQHLGRLDCLCKFHESCLTRWWRTKGSHECPTHKAAWQDSSDLLLPPDDQQAA